MNEIEEIRAIEAVRRLKAEYCRLADTRQWEALSALFTPEGSMAFFDIEGALVSETVGRRNIVSRLSESVGKAQPVHHVFSAEIEVLSPIAATGVWAMEDYIFRSADDPAEFKTMHGFGHYHESYEVRDGHWCIASLKLKRLKLDFY